MKTNNYNVFSDEELLALLHQDDTLSLQTIFTRYYTPLAHFSTIFTKDITTSEVLIADLFIKLWDNRKQLEIRLLKPYLFQSAKNLSLNHLKKHKPKLDTFENLQTRPSEHLTPFEILTNKESQQRILSLINLLPERQREVLLMSRIEQIEKTNIAPLLGITVRTVETTLYQAIKSLRTLLFTSGKKI
ncbi:RNA polymerase sigma-70 factor (ECF subfamily) [Pedobacter cryoconitis]|uniref:RNA polymerase sigma-70 factor (ECF subfamily) n=1 Tax=Pedobacter cryoconitis TaxID=188932 RepID=A0A7W9DZ87_9SPHI|nr:sigma-70 family RNA polymerase sigma factor [Pedobacter cryoconitis]MBB5635290.1 RNA polymerase sigma-70 factor (ECF subfamily) [Pedobacter cryoconitis]MBB6274098.1 RNA polymerase sigma-70 factor (ECF subfamily) [Pedobacter cryoconitis]